MNPYGSFNVAFSNQLPDLLERELSRANELGIIPIKVGDPKFDPVINQGTIKWAVTIEGELVVIPKFVNGEEIPHTVLTHGQFWRQVKQKLWEKAENIFCSKLITIAVIFNLHRRV